MTLNKLILTQRVPVGRTATRKKKKLLSKDAPVSTETHFTPAVGYNCLTFPDHLLGDINGILGRA